MPKKPIDPIGHADTVFPHVDTTKAGHTDTVVSPHVDTPPVHTDAKKIHTDTPARHIDIVDRLPE
jgi:hypothetical protein